MQFKEKKKKDFGVRLVFQISDPDMPFILESHLTSMNFNFLLQNEDGNAYFTELRTEGTSSG